MFLAVRVGDAECGVLDSEFLVVALDIFIQVG